MFVVGEDEETDAEHSVDLCAQILEIDICEIVYLELDAGGHYDLLRLFVQVQNAEALLNLLYLGLTGLGCRFGYLGGLFWLKTKFDHNQLSNFIIIHEKDQFK